MEKEEEIEKLKIRIKEKSLVISRVPPKVKKDFISLANQGFCSYYGMTLGFIFDQAMEYQAMKNTFFENMNFKLDHIIGLLIDKNILETQEEKPEKETITLVSGRKVEKSKGGGK